MKASSLTLRGSTLISFVVLAAFPIVAADVRLNMVVSGNLMQNDGKGTYSTGLDGVGVWLEPSRWPHMAFDFCMNWPFPKAQRLPPAAGPRTVVHHLTQPVTPDGKALGAFPAIPGNDIAILKPLTSSVATFEDMQIGTSVNPDSTEVRFCNAKCTEYYSLIFGAKSVFYGDASPPDPDIPKLWLKINGSGTTKPTVTRTSEKEWVISFPTSSVGRLWRRSGELTDLGLYHYDGRIELEKQ